MPSALVEPVLLVAAMRDEIAAVPPRQGVVRLVTGVGRQRVTGRLAEAIERHRPGSILLAGVCGALSPARRCGQVLTVGHALHGDERLPLAEGDAVCLTVDQPALEPDARRRLHAASGADIVDMETFHVADVAAGRGLPLVAIRAVSDAVEDVVPAEALQWISDDGAPDLAAAARWAMLHPWRVGQLRRLQRQFQTATAALADAVIGRLDR